MKKLILVALLAVACSTTGSVKDPLPSIEKECIELTEEVKAERAEHERQLDALSKYMEAELKQVRAFMLSETGDLLEMVVRDRNFANDYEMAIVYVTGHKEGRHVVDLYFIIANPLGGQPETLGLLAREPVDVRLERQKLLEEAVEDILQFKQKLIEEGEKEQNEVENNDEFEL